MSFMLVFAKRPFYGSSSSTMIQLVFQQDHASEGMLPSSPTYRSDLLQPHVPLRSQVHPQIASGGPEIQDEAQGRPCCFSFLCFVFLLSCDLFSLESTVVFLITL